jgi:outer membrane usher protein FimD/PapC
LDELDIRNDTGHELSASLRQSLPSNIYASAGASYAISRTRPDPLRYSLSIGRPFGKVLANLFMEKSRRLDGRAETSAVASLSIRFGSRSSIRAQYRSRTNEKLIEYERSIYNGVGEWGARTGFNSSSSGTSFQGNVDLYANRGELGLRTGVVESINGNQVIDSTLRGAFGLAFAGGEFAVGRPVYEGFAILKRHRSLRRNRVSVPAGMFSGGSLATTDLFGPALVPLTRGYQVQQFDVSVDELPVGYDAGASRFTVLTGARAGMALTVGSDAVNSVLGTLTYPDGEPVRLVAGVLRRRGSDTSSDVEFFTNRTGRFAAEKLRPGIYSIIVSKVDTGASLTIPEDADGLVQTGKITVERQ